MFEVESVTCSVFYRDEAGEMQMFSANSQTVDTTVEKLGQIERKLAALKKANENR